MIQLKQKLSSHPAYVNGLKHQTILAIDEQGVQSTPNNNLLISTASRDTDKQDFSFVLDRPFFSLIRDNQTGNIIFMGVIFEP